MSAAVQPNGLRDRETVLAGAAKRLADAGIESARLDAELLLAHALEVSREKLVSGDCEMSPVVVERFERALARRVAREPLAYITGRKEFFLLEFEVTRDVLIPRPETEALVDAALKFLASRSDAHILDIGTGSGAIAIAIAAHAPTLRVSATDVSTPALGVARRNASRLGVESRVEFRIADVFETVQAASLGRYDLIVSNPPYVSDAEIESLAAEIRNYEPRLALAGGPDGMDFYRRIAGGCESFLADGGAVMVEVGAGQAAAVAGVFAAAGLRRSDVINDLAGIVRVVTVRR